MGIFDCLRSSAFGNASQADLSEPDALRLIDAGHALEAEGHIEEAMQRYLEAVRLAPRMARAHLNLGNALLASGDLQGALKAFRTAIKHQPDYAGAYYNIGNALLGNGRLDEAVTSYRQALDIQPDYAEAHYALGVAMQNQGKLEGAVTCFRRALDLNPGFVEAHFNLGITLQRLGRLEDAVSSYRKTLEIKPDFAELYNILGATLHDLGQLEEAVANYHIALEIKPDFAEVHNNLGITLRDSGLLDSAAASFRHALKFKPDFVEALNNLGITLHDLGQLDEAVTSFRRALEIKPDYAEAHNNLGGALHELGQLDEAVTSFRRALEIKPDFAETHNNLGFALHDLGQLDEAVISCRRALEIKPDYAEAHSNLGGALRNLMQLDEAVTSYRRALEIKPDYAEAHFNLSLLLLSMGRYTEAWPRYEARYHPDFKRKDVILPEVSFPQWHGEPLAGKSLVIWPEQGYGDEIQFARYIPELKSRGASRITLVCKTPLVALLGTLKDVDAVVSQSEAASLPFHDYWTYPMSLPLHFATTVETIPNVLPYLDVLPEWLDRWRDRLPAGRLKVGLVWKGNAAHKNDINRSLPNLSILEPLWSVPGITFISLQKWQGEEEAATPPTGQPILHLGSDVLDFADTASIVAQIDLVICIDTAIAHLAGAMNKPCWVLLPAIGVDWRWLHERTDSPWYPGVMRLFRQKKAGDWAATISEVAQALEIWVGEHRDAIQVR